MNENLNKNPWSKQNESMDNARIHNISNRDMLTNKSESPESFRHNNNFFPFFNFNNNFNQSNSIIYNNNFNLSHIHENNKIQNVHNIYPNNINVINHNNFLNPVNNINNINIINDVNMNLNNSTHNNNNLNLSYNYNPYINNSFEDLNILSKKRGDSFNSCPSLKGNHLSSFKSTDDSCNNNNNNNHHINNNHINNNINYVNKINNNFIMPKSFNNNMNSAQYLSMQKLFLNLNPITASLMRNNNHFYQHNPDKNLNFNIPLNNNNHHHNNYHKPMSLFNRNNNSNPKRLHYNHSYHNINRASETNNLNNMNINNINNNSFDNKIYNDNLSNNSNVGSSHSIKKKRTSLFQNESNKEKDLRDFKRFCDGLKMPMSEYICSQIGSRIMQKYLKKFPSHIRTILINKISPYMNKLMCNTYGNYFCQKLYNTSDLQQRLIILNSLKQSFISICKNNSGAHAIQFIINSIQTIEEKKIILDSISSHELTLAYDPEGTHVLQKIINCFKEDEIKGLNDILCEKNNLNCLCQDAKGICVIKKLISVTKDENIKNKIIEQINVNCTEIALSPFGNYIIQMIFEEWDINICFKLVENCLNNCVILSCQKYSSNIIVKIIEVYCNENIIEDKYNISNKLKNIFFDEKNLFDLYNNKYGRLIFNKIIKLIKPEEKENIKKKYENYNDDNEGYKKNLDIINELFIKIII